MRLAIVCLVSFAAGVASMGFGAYLWLDRHWSFP